MGKCSHGLLLSIVLFYFFCATVTAAPSLKIAFGNNDGSYSISIDGKLWFSSSSYNFHVSNTWYSTKNSTLKLTATDKDHGSDMLGVYDMVLFKWSAGTVPFYTSFKTYRNRPNVIVFAQEFPQGATGTSIGSQDQPLTTFPNLLINGTLGFLHYNQDMAGYIYQTGLFPNGYIGGYMGGPLAVYDENLNTVVMSSFSYFMSVVTNIDKSNGNALNTGIQGKVQNITNNFKFEYVLYADQGVNKAFMGWGDLLLTKYEKTRVLPDASVVLAYLGYSTTGYYFYNPLDYNRSYGNYERTLLDFNDYSKKLGVPYRHYLLDSWWYGEYSIYNDGVWKWEDSPEFLKERFPHGLEYLHRELGVPFAAHIGKWLANSPYTANPSFGFVIENTYAIPTRVELYDFIFQNASQWGLNTLKQDHINEQILLMSATLADVHTTRDWLLAEGRGLAHHGINIEYCMDWCNVLLTSLENPTATHSRAGQDYVPQYADAQWRIGVSSMFLWAIGLYPDKDTFYSTTTEQVLNPTSTFYKFQEPYPLVHAIASSMSAGPITPSDGIDGTDKDLIMRMCAADGLLLKPDRPAVNIDSTWTRAFSNNSGPVGDVITSYTTIGVYTWHYVFAAGLKAPYKFTSDDVLEPWPANSQAVAFVYNTTSTISPQLFGVGTPLIVPSGGLGSPYLFIIAPVLDNGWVYLGETNKFITVSRQRTVSVATGSQSVNVEIAGTAGEVVTLSFVASPATSLKVSTYKCTIGPAGRSTFVVPSAVCMPS